MTILEVRQLTIWFPNQNLHEPVVNDISFSLEEGETLGVVGESGSGKSLTALSIAGLLPRAAKIVSGAIMFGEEPEKINLLSLSEKQMHSYRGKKIAMIFQDPMASLNPVFTCGTQVDEVSELHLNLSKAAARSHTLTWFKKVGLTDSLRMYASYPHQLSGGQKQRVMIAMAMSCNPSILIADEPTTALDSTLQADILQLMKELRDSYRMSMIFISHDLGIVREVADRIIIIYRGRIIESGTVDKIFSDPREPYTRALLACRPPVSKQLKRLAVVSDYLLNDETKMASHDDTNRHEEITQPEIDRRRETLKHESSILIVKNLSVHFKIKNSFLSKAVVIKAVDEVSFEVKRGETLGLVGESGSGKSTLCNAILRLTETLGGQAIFENKNLLAVSGKDLRLMRKDIQIIFQDPYSALNPKLTVGYMIMEPMIVHRIFKNDKDQKEKALQLLSAVNLSADSFYKFPHEFSEGQMQRICIARALACNPKFLICDECVSSLDVSVQAEVLNLLISLREEFQLSCLFVSHDLSVVRFMSDRIMIMKEGRIIETGSPEEIFDHPKSGYTKHLLSAIL